MQSRFYNTQIGRVDGTISPISITHVGIQLQTDTRGDFAFWSRVGVEMGNFSTYLTGSTILWPLFRLQRRSISSTESSKSNTSKSKKNKISFYKSQIGYDSQILLM